METTIFSSSITFWFCSRSLLFFLFLYPNAVLSGTMLVRQDGLKNYKQIDLPGVIGPESIAFDCNGRGPYVGVSDGRILKWQGAKFGWAEFAFSSPSRNRKACDSSTNPKMEPMCGRPLGLKFSPATCDLYIADAYFGLLVVGPKGGMAKQLANSAEGVPFRFTNALDIDTKTGVVYFTDSSMHFPRNEYLLAIISLDNSGRLLKYDPGSKKVTVLYKKLAVPNGIALSQDNSFILVAESGKLRILKFSLSGTQIQDAPEVFVQLGRFPDNVKRNRDGEFWVALNSGRGRIQGLQELSASLGQENGIKFWLVGDPVAVKVNKGGEVVKVLDGGGGKILDSVSEVEEQNGVLWLGSSVQPYVGYVRN